MDWSIELFLGAFFVIFHAYAQFNDPVTNRSSTTAVQYYTAMLSYLGLAFFLYVLLAVYPHVLEHLGEVPQSLKGLSTPFMAALVLTVLLPKFPGLARMDKWIRRWFQYMAAIPYEARRLSAELRQSQFDIPDEIKEHVKQKLEQKGIHSEDILFQQSNSPQYLWTKISALMTQLEKTWEPEQRFAGFLTTFAEDYKMLKKRYAELSPRAATCFHLIRDFSDHSGDQALKEAVDECKRNFLEQCDHLFRSICDIFSRGVLQCNMTQASRQRQLSELGFHVIERRTLNFNQLTSLFLAIFFVFLFGFSMLGSQAGDFAENLLLGIMIATIYSVAVACATLPKAGWKFANKGADGTRPWVFYLVAGLMAIVVGLLIGLAFSLITLTPGRHPFLASWTNLQQTYPWYFMAFVIAFVTAFQLDNNPKDSQGKDRPYLQWMEGISQGVLTALAAVFVAKYALPAVPGASPANAFISAILSLVVGFIIGFLVPSWYRRVPHEQEKAGDIAHEPVCYLRHN